MSDPLINQTIGGCAILEVIGQGGMGVIYKGRQKSLDRVVAVKVLAPHLANDINFVTRFQKEARSIARVNHPHILAVYDVGTDQNINYMIMELIEGESLAEMQAERRGALEWREASEFIRQAAQGLEAAMATGIIHRDIKPENLMVTRKGQIKVSDFGLAKEADGTGTQTSVDSVMGTPAFMSPEQCDGKKVDGRSDIYSLGGTWYRLITGRLPFEAETAMSTMYRHKHEALIPPNEVLPTVPRAISDVICKMMAKKREHRYQTFTEVIDAIDAAIEKTEQAEKGGDVGNYDAPMPMSGMAPASNYQDAGQQRSNVPSRFTPGSGNTDFGNPMQPGPGISGTGLSGPVRRGVPNSARSGMPGMPGLPGMGGGFMPGGEQSRVNSVLGGQGPMSGMGGMGGMGPMGGDDGYANVSRGDEMLERGDRVNAMKAYMLALNSQSLDNATRKRVEQEVDREFAIRRQNADNLLKRGMLVDAQRECRILAELEPNDATLKALLKDIESRLALKRTLVNDIRNAIAGSQFENAIKIWDGTPAELRDDALGKQIEQLRVIVVPAAKLAEQGESFSHQGRLEEAIATYEDALKINASCEQARLGLKESEGKLQRIDFLLKEGYQYNLEQNYGKAIETWKPILNLRPGHPQAIKSIVEAYIQHGQTLRAQGELDAALNLYRGARDTDPTNRTVARMTDEITMLRDKEKLLLDRATEAMARGRLGEAIHCWKDISVLNPANRKAQQQIQQIAKKRSGNAAVTFVVVILIFAGGIVGFQYWQEQSLLSKGKKLIDERKYAEAVDVFQKHTFIFFNADSTRFREDAFDENEIQQAEARAFTDPRGGSDDYRNLALRLEKRKPQRSRRLYELALETLSTLYLAQARDAVKLARWQDAANQYARLEREMKQLKDFRNDMLNKAEEDMNTAKGMIAAIVEAERVALSGNSEGAFEKYTLAEKLATQLKFDETVALIQKQLEASHYNPDVYNKSMEQGIALLATAQPDLAEAERLFNIAMQNHPNDVKGRMYLAFVNDQKFCDMKGQAMYSERRPSPKNPTFMWGVDDRRKAFCIDRYEFPNTPGEMPMVDVPFAAASQICAKEGKKLCTSTRWKDACQGSTNATYPYGNGKDLNAALCNVEGKGLTASGSKKMCQNSLGIFDMSGNAAEWTEDMGDGADVTVMGGSFKESANDANCMSTFSHSREDKMTTIGFRCCRDLEVKEK